MTFTLESPAFDDGAEIPARHLRDAENLSPPLHWREAPLETKSFVLIVMDHDAPSGTFHHWAAFDIPGERTGLPEGAGAGPEMGVGEKSEKVPEGQNDFGHAGYDGPQPPPGHGPHRYHFRLGALDVPSLGLPEGTRAADVWEAAQPHLVAEAQLTGVYEKR